MKSNIYGHHMRNGTRDGKETVVNKFVDRAHRGDPLTVYRPDTQALDFIQIEDVARAYERALETVQDGEPGGHVAEEELDQAPETAVVENPPSSKR